MIDEKEAGMASSEGDRAVREERDRLAREMAAGDGVLRVVALRDPGVEAWGFRAGDDYCMTYWLPVLGPTAVLAHAKLAGPLAFLDELAVPMRALAAELGVRDRGGLWAPLPRAVGRLARFGGARPADGTLAVRTHMPPLSPRMAERLPGHLRERHAALLATRRAA